MLVLLDPQPPTDEDVPNWHRDDAPGGGLGITNSTMFVPFPGEDMTGVKIIKYKGFWYWARPEFYNTTNPLEVVRNELKDLNVFYEPQLSIIAGAVNYVANNPSSSGSDHHLQVVIAMMYELLSCSLFHLTDSQPLTVLNKFKEWEIENI